MATTTEKPVSAYFHDMAEHYVRQANRSPRGSTTRKLHLASARYYEELSRAYRGGH